MASQPSSVQNEERNRLRLQAWEQRNQETSQSSEFSPESSPVFGEPYKIYKGDELSNRIRRMLGTYEDVDSPGPLSVEGLPIPAYVTFSQSDQRPPNSDKSTKPPFHSHSPTESQTGPSTVTFSSQPAKVLSAASSPKHDGQSSTNCTSSLNHSQSSELCPSAQLKTSELPSALMEMSSPSPDAKPPPPSHSSDQKATDIDAEEPFEGQKLQRSEDLPAESLGTVDVSTQNMKQSPKDLAVSQTNKAGTLPSQTFPPPLSSKQPCVIMTQKPTAYVRPMDGQDQVTSESPELKPSPEPYLPVAELINKSDLSKATKPQPLEPRADEAQCVEDILREMTESWPPLLTALHTPNTREPSKFLFPVKEAERVSSCPGQKNRDSSSSISSNLKQQPSSNSCEAEHSSGRETSSSSDSGSSSGSEWESENPGEELQPSDQSHADAGPALGPADWQLGNWIRSSQQRSSAEGPALKQLPHTQSSKHSGVEAIGPTGTSRPHVSIPQQRSETPQDKRCRHSRQKPVSADVNGGSSSRKLSNSTKAGRPDRIVKSEAAATTQTKDSCFTDKPKVKTKAGHGENIRDKAATLTELKRTKNTLLKGQKAAAPSEPEASLLLPPQCPSCGVRHPNRCSCSTQSPAQPRPPALAPPHTLTRSKSKAETRKPRKTTDKHLKAPGHTASHGQGLSRPPLSLLVKINLSLLSRVPQTPTSTPQGIPSTVRTSAAVGERGRGGGAISAKHKHTKSSKKHKMPNVDGEDSSIPRKKQKLENNHTSLLVSRKPEISNKPAEAVVKKKVKKPPQQPAPLKSKAQDPKFHRSSSGRSVASSRASSKPKKSEKHKEHPPGEKLKPPKRSVAAPSPSQPVGHALTNRPLLRSEDRLYPVKHYIKEAKRLKHKADAESDKLSKAFSYLDAAMFFVESAIAMEKDPQISMSSYTMFAETLELLKFVLKLKNSLDSSSSPSEKDFLALCLKCQSLLQMAMFRHKHKTALKYSKILTDHFNTSAQATHNPAKLADQPSPGTPSPLHAGAAVVVPQAIEQVAFSYINITTLVLSAHALWEQAEELAEGGSGLLSELDTVLGPLSLSAGLGSLVRYTRQAVHWLRLTSLKV